jgi:hypothetical protein
MLSTLTREQFRQGDLSMRPLYIVAEEAWSISAKANERRLLDESERPLFSGGSKRLAYAYARQRASEFKYHGLHDEGDQLYWWGRNDGDPVNRRFVIKPAPPSLPVSVGKDSRSRGRHLPAAPPAISIVDPPDVA